jgi:hypothetical protein
MTRSFDTIPNEMDHSSEVPKPPPQVMSVCPFCGAISEKNDGPCPRCKMENSALTRQATRARVGPWYVMQSRNPSAPGMKCSTLLALIRKGQLTPRSVIRGPTTFQLWRFAARVKGISREFGLCYSCGSEVQRTSTFCARCSRSQELPPNPDALLENEIQAAKPVYRELKSSRPPSPGALERPRSDSQRDEPARTSGSGESDPLRTNRPQTQLPSAAETMAELAEMPSPHNAPPEMQTRPRQRPQEGVLSPRELAAAFSLQYDPTMDVPGARRRRRRGGAGKRLLVLAVLLLAVGGVIATFYYVPSLRQSVIAWVQDASPPANASTDSPPIDSPAPKPLATQTPPWMMPPPVDSPPITTPVKSSLTNSTPQSNALLASTPKPAANVQLPSTPAPIVQPNPDPKPAPIGTNVAVLPQSDPATAAAAAAADKLRQSDGNDLDRLAMELRSNGMDAEHRQDFEAAKYYYQQVEQLPHDHWPGDIDQLLKGASKKVVGGDSH